MKSCSFCQSTKLYNYTAPSMVSSSMLLIHTFQMISDKYKNLLAVHGNKLLSSIYYLPKMNLSYFHFSAATLYAIIGTVEGDIEHELRHPNLIIHQGIPASPGACSHQGNSRTKVVHRNI